MDQRLPSSIRREDIDEVEKIVARLTARKSQEPEKSAAQIRLEKIAIAVHECTVSGAGLMVVGAVLNLMFQSHALYLVLVAFAGLLGLLVIATSLLVTGSAIPFLKQRRAAPFAQIFSLMTEAIALDLPEVLRLLQCDRSAVEYVLVHYRHRRSAFERRHALISGPLEKIGLFPGLAAFVVVAIKIWEVNSSWLHTLIFVIPALYIVTFFDYELVEEMDRAIALLEYSLEMRDRSDNAPA